MTALIPDKLTRLPLLVLLGVLQLNPISEGRISKDRFDITTKDLNQLCPLIPGFDEFDTTTDSRSKSMPCYKFHWNPDPCTMEKSGRVESDFLHCGRYSMTTCTDIPVEDRNVRRGLSGYDLTWSEVSSLCNTVVKNKKAPPKIIKFPDPYYWKWNFCENGTGPELRPCGFYSMTLDMNAIMTQYQSNNPGN